MLRLTPPNYDKIRVATSFEASYGGAEANIALALANLGIDSTFFSVVPNNSLGKSAMRMLRSNNVHCEVFQRLVEDTSDEEHVVEGIRKVFSSWIAERILNFNSDLFYQPREYIAECYRAGVIIPA